jgi:MFS family permease
MSTGLFLAIPFGILADKYGRKWLMVLNVISICLRTLWTYVVCESKQYHLRMGVSEVNEFELTGAFPDTFPIRLVWLKGLSSLLGGGSLVTVSLFIVVITDVTPESTR